MKIGVPRESLAGETRVAITPDVVKKLTGKGFEILIEAGAGESAHFPDDEYSAVGGTLVSNAEALAAEIVVKLRKPSAKEVAAMADGAIYIGLVESCGEDESIKAMQAKGIRVLAMERIPRTSRAQSMDALSSQSNIAGYRAVIEAAAHYGRFLPLMMTSAGSAKPAKLVVLGAGVAGLQAIATARRLGADVHAYDVRPETKEQIESLGAKAIELDIGESGSGEGGYARELSDEAKAKQQQALADALAKAHVIISTAMIPCRPAPVLITEEVVKRMRAGSVIVDLAAASGGNCPLSEADQVVKKHDVIIVGHTNYPAMVPSDASAFYAGNLRNLLDIMVEQGEAGLQLKDLDEDEITEAMQLRADA
ncbi:Re/Si-specific NAD(P)(+) transhydrogenase subunit alpha [Candidatus Endoriftia persephone]|jgi:NAD(P) transhydrogenase subunit alpha|uniref:NAD(P) transhydrogenase subunit alpha part 1 n=2 Tax=Gammaproteobacteria TaxID=1236 RepID=G2DD50_9GAMM|nr:Re/Si-specific NAD(P)(+) transhydrogenase subunit alpha [Candidatus Endoriftia persephone]EGV51429.1 NAD(P) transhydrogenase subunit alpha part 1 [endosymbiont of Riftia pachyptila (vent Ph05)]USF86480.1 Re/Si-specific NAD(P)(+) transhydrogenase subunit alpha [Candidatus Endoriftia persephone]